MRVAMYYNNQDVRLEEMPTPKIGPGELLVKVFASGICGSDVMEWYRIKKAPLVLGHEITGEIVEAGKGVEGYKIGDRVFVSHHVPCHTCYYCRKGYHTVCDTLRSTSFDPGGFAEYLRVPQVNVNQGVFLLPEDISFEDGTFIEPLACVVRGMRLAERSGVPTNVGAKLRPLKNISTGSSRRKSGSKSIFNETPKSETLNLFQGRVRGETLDFVNSLKFQPGYSVLVLGSGISGLLNILLARAQGASRVMATDINAYRLKVAKNLGADVTISAEEDIPTRVRNANEHRLADFVIISTGAPSAFTQAFKCVDRGGTVLFFAPPEPGFNLNLPGYEFWRDQITLISTYAASSEDITTAIELIRTQKVQVHDLITHRLSLGEVSQGFQMVAKANESLKVIIEPYR